MNEFNLMDEFQKIVVRGTQIDGDTIRKFSNNIDLHIHLSYLMATRIHGHYHHPILLDKSDLIVCIQKYWKMDVIPLDSYLYELKSLSYNFGFTDDCDILAYEKYLSSLKSTVNIFKNLHPRSFGNLIFNDEYTFFVPKSYTGKRKY